MEYFGNYSSKISKAKKMKRKTSKRGEKEKQIFCVFFLLTKSFFGVKQILKIEHLKPSVQIFFDIVYF